MISILCSIALLAQVVAIPAQQDPLTQNRAPVRANPAPNPFAAPSPRVDRLFAVAANASSNAEITFAQLALQRGRTDEVKSYARTMISEHIGLMKALMPHVQHVLGRMPPHELAPADALTYYRLEHVADVDFDQTYVLTQVAGHLVTLGVFQAESDNGADTALKRTVRQWLPTIQSHLQLAVDLTQHIGGDSPLKTGAQ